MRTKSGKFVLFALLFLGAAVLWFTYGKIASGGAHDSVLFIKQHLNGRGQISDMQEEIFVRGQEDDISWFQTSKGVEIRYGKVKLKYKLEDLSLQETIYDLQSIFIEFRQDKSTGELYMFYRGNKIEKSVKL